MTSSSAKHRDKNIGDRVRCVLKSCGSPTKLQEKTGIRSTTWQNVRYDKQKVNEDHITAVCEAFPEYRMWVETGKIAPDSGQVSPRTCRNNNHNNSHNNKEKNDV